MEGYIGEIRMFGGNFAPRAWAFCSGQLLAISQNTALFSILGTTYGGDGRTTFALPDLRGRIPYSQGTGPGLSPIRLGERAGTETNTMNILTMAAHNHLAIKSEGTLSVKVSEATADENSAVGNFLTEQNPNPFYASTNGTEDYGGVAAQVSATAGMTGNQQPINNLQPFIVSYYIICLQGIYPSRS